MSVVFASGGLSWTRVRTPRVLSQIAKAMLAIGALIGMMGAHEPDLAAFAVVFSSLPAIALFIVSYILSFTQTSFAGSLEIHPHHLEIDTADSRVAIANERIRSALLVEREMFGASVATVEIELVNGDVLVARLPERGAAAAVVSALGFGPGGARVHASLASPSRRLFQGLLGVMAFVVSLLGLAIASDELRLQATHPGLESVVVLAYPLLALALHAVAKRLHRAPEITAGDDGVLVQGRLRRRFIPRREIVQVSAAPGTSMLIETRSGKRVRVNGLLLDRARRVAIARVIRERSGPSAASPDRFAHYERGGRALPEWRAHLAHAMNEASYRENAATVDEAAAVLRSAEASPEQRVGAALALRVAGEPKARILVAADAAIDGRVREALEAVVESDEDAPLEKALRRLS